MAVTNNSYKTFIISKWDSASTGLTQYATTWQIAKDSNFTNLVIDNQEDTVNLYEWKTNIVVPKDEVWYIRAKRHLKDSNGNVVNYDKWIGPEPIISDESNINELLVPEMYIEQPSILDYNIDATSINIEIADPIGNVPNIKTYVSIYKDNVMLYSKKVTTNNIIIDSSEVDYIGLDKFQIVLIHEGDFSVVSNPTVIRISYSDNLFEIVGNLRNLDPVNINIIKVVAKETSGVRVSYASVMDMDSGDIIPCPVKNNSEVYIEPSKLNHNHKLILRVFIEYIDPKTNETKTVEKDYPISFKEFSEVDTQIENITYLYVIEYYTETTTIPMDKHVIIAEEASTGIIPVLKNNNLTLITVTPENDDFITVNNDTGISITDAIAFSNIQIVDINGTDYIILLYTTDNNINKIQLYNLDYVKNTVSPLVKEFTLPNSQSVSNNSLFYYKNKLCVGYLNGNVIEIYEINNNNTDLVLLETITLPSDITDLTEIVINNIDIDTLSILPIGNDAVYNYVYFGNYKKLEIGDNIPDSLRLKRVTGIRQLNGNIVYTPLVNNDDIYTFMVYDRKTNKINEYRYDIGTTDPLKNTIMFKDRTLDKLYLGSVTKIYRLR